jgi:hypothetical protein
MPDPTKFLPRVRAEVQDDHVFIVIECPNRPTISIDVTNCHSRRGVAIRVDGMGIFNALVDLKELPKLLLAEHRALEKLYAHAPAEIDMPRCVECLILIRDVVYPAHAAVERALGKDQV